MLVCPGRINRDSSADSSEGRCWKPATSRACCIFPGFSSHLGTELLSEKYVFLTRRCLKLVSALGSACLCAVRDGGRAECCYPPRLGGGDSKLTHKPCWLQLPWEPTCEIYPSPGACLHPSCHRAPVCHLWGCTLAEVSCAGCVSIGLPCSVVLLARFPPRGQQDHPGCVFLMKTNKTSPSAALFTIGAWEESS